MRAMLPTTLQVAAGGAVGAAARHAVGLALARPGFPVAVLAANVAGSFAMGALVIWLARRGLDGWRPFLLSGVLGGFTTFSAFSLETVTLMERGQAWQAAAYVALSVGLAVGALALGVAVARAFA